MTKTIITIVTLIALGLALCACGAQGPQSQSINNLAAAAAPTPTPEQANAVSLSAIDALLADYSFILELKKKAQLSDKEIANLKKLSRAEVTRLQSASGVQSADAEDPRARALRSIRELLGQEKADQVLALGREHWNRSGDNLVTTNDFGTTLLQGPNAVPPDTRIVVNIPAFRMDVFSGGKLLKSWRIGIGYQDYPLPTGFRKAEVIIFNPTWTQPNEPWASNPGLVVPAGAPGNPLGPIKVPIGGANLIHGGKALAKIGTFASHGCVGLTNEQVRDFAKVLADGTSTELKSETMLTYLKVRTRTQVVKLSMVVPVELRYETMVIQEGQLHVYRDVYNKNTNTEENLRATFAASGINFDNLPEEEKMRALEAVNAMSLRPKKLPTPKPMPTPASNQNSADQKALVAERKTEAERISKLKNRKEIVIEIASLSGKGYPAPKDLNTGASTGTLSIAMDTTPRPEPARRPSPGPTATAGSSPATLRPSPTPAAGVPSPTQPRTSPTQVPQSSPRTNPTPATQSTPGTNAPRRSTSGLP